MMPHSVFFILYHRIEIHVFHATENIGFHERICLFQLRDEFFRLKALGGCGSVLMTCRAGIREMTRTL